MFFAEKTTINATQTHDTVFIAVSFKSKPFEKSFNRSFIVRSFKLFNLSFSIIISLKSIRILLIIVAVIQIDALLKTTKKKAAIVDNNRNGQ